MYAVFIRNNRAPFHLGLKENLVKFQKVTKDYENDCSTEWQPVQTFKFYMRNCGHFVQLKTKANTFFLCVHNLKLLF